MPREPAYKNLMAIHLTVNKISCPQDFQVAIFRLWLGAKKNIWEELPKHIGHVCKK